MPILPLHLFSLGFSFVSIALANHEAFRWLRGKTPLLELSKIRRYHYLVLLGLTLMIVTGFFLFWPAKDFLITRPPFWAKMTLVLTLIINSFFIGSLLPVATTRPFASLSKKEKIPLFVSGGISAIGWIGAVIFATMLFPK